MFEYESRKRKTRAFYDNDYKMMSEQGFKPNGWMNYQNSPYAEHKKFMEEINGNKAGSSKTDT